MLASYFRREFVEPIYELMTNSPKIQHWKRLSAEQYLPITEIKAKQWQKLKNILAYSYNNTKYYKSLFDKHKIHPAEINKPEDMRRVPILTKDIIRKNTKEMISYGHDITKLIKYKTGGSTGRALEIYADEECSELRNAAAWMFDEWSGWKMGEPIGALWGNTQQSRTIKDKLKKWFLFPVIYLDTMEISEDSVNEFAAKWRKFKPTLLFGHAHSLYLLAEYVDSLGITDINPKAIISSSMMLLPHERKIIEKIFSRRVFDRYGCEEVSLISAECEMHDGMHINSHHLYVEFINENEEYCKPGELGRIIVTDLVNRAMPLVRYAVEDLGITTERICCCGRGLPLMEKVVGRVADSLVKKDGSKVAGISLIENTLTKIPGIKQLQIIQESIYVIKLNIVKNELYNVDRETELKRYFRTVFGTDSIINIVYVEDIQAEHSGKYRFSICNIK